MPGYEYVVPLMVTQGVNELQLACHTSPLHSDELQQDINRRALRTLRSYVSAHRDYHLNRVFPVEAEAEAEARAEVRQAEMLLRKYATAVEAQAGAKADVNLLLLSCRLCRTLGGGVAVSCKSAKDRTSMAVTYDQAEILARAHGLPRRYVLPVANRMRVQGVRRANCFHNIGKPLFAFNGLQLQCLPRIYRPPEHVAGAKKS